MKYNFADTPRRRGAPYNASLYDVDFAASRSGRKDGAKRIRAHTAQLYTGDNLLAACARRLGA